MATSNKTASYDILVTRYCLALKHWPISVACSRSGSTDSNTCLAQLHPKTPNLNTGEATGGQGCITVLYCGILLPWRCGGGGCQEQAELWLRRQGKEMMSAIFPPQGGKILDTLGNKELISKRSRTGDRRGPERATCGMVHPSPFFFLVAKHSSEGRRSYG